MNSNSIGSLWKFEFTFWDIIFWTISVSLFFYSVSAWPNLKIFLGRLFNLSLSFTKKSNLSLKSKMFPSLETITVGAIWLSIFISYFFVLELVWLIIKNSFLCFSFDAKITANKASVIKLRSIKSKKSYCPL